MCHKCRPPPNCRPSHADFAGLGTAAAATVWDWLMINKLCGRPPQYAPPLQVDIWPFNLESGVRVTCDVGCLCANFGLPRPLCSRLRPDVRGRQASDAHHRSMPLPQGRGIIISDESKRHSLGHCWFASPWIRPRSAHTSERPDGGTDGRTDEPRRRRCAVRRLDTNNRRDVYGLD